MFKFVVFFAILTIGLCQDLKYHGPFFIWGPSVIEEIKSPALGVVNDGALLSLYEKVKSVVVFVTDTSDRIDANSFPELKSIVEKESLVYLAQPRIPHPKGVNVKVHVVPLTGAAAAQDKVIKSTLDRIRDADGRGNIIGILANADDDGSLRSKREAEEPSVPAIDTNDTQARDFIYYAKGEAIIYTELAPVLFLDYNVTNRNYSIMKVLSGNPSVTIDKRGQVWKLFATFADGVNKTVLRFKFNVSSGYWAMKSVEVSHDESKIIELVAVGAVPEAPLGFSYKCMNIVFANGTNNLTMYNVQLQSFMGGGKRFNDTIDCIGFTTAPIWSGIFVSFLILFGTLIGITALMDIKPPNRFESSRSKQLTFTVQE